MSSSDRALREDWIKESERLQNELEKVEKKDVSYTQIRDEVKLLVMSCYTCDSYVLTIVNSC